MFGQCPAKIGSWPPPRYLWTDAGGSLAGKRQDFYLPLPPLSLAAPLRIEREGRKYVSQRAFSLARSPRPPRPATAAHMTPPLV